MSEWLERMNRKLLAAWANFDEKRSGEEYAEGFKWMEAAFGRTRTEQAILGVIDDRFPREHGFRSHAGGRFGPTFRRRQACENAATSAKKTAASSVSRRTLPVWKRCREATTTGRCGTSRRGKARVCCNYSVWWKGLEENGTRRQGFDRWDHIRGVLVFLCCVLACACASSRRLSAVASITSGATSRLRVLAEYPDLGRVTHLQASVTHGR